MIKFNFTKELVKGILYNIQHQNNAHTKTVL